MTAHLRKNVTITGVPLRKSFFAPLRIHKPSTTCEFFTPHTSSKVIVRFFPMSDEISDVALRFEIIAILVIIEVLSEIR